MLDSLDSVYIEDDVKIIDHCNITEKYRGPTHRDIKIKINQKIPIVFHNLKNYDSYRIMQELHKSNFRINIIVNRLEKIHELQHQ